MYTLSIDLHPANGNGLSLSYMWIYYRLLYTLILNHSNINLQYNRNCKAEYIKYEAENNNFV